MQENIAYEIIVYTTHIFCFIISLTCILCICAYMYMYVCVCVSQTYIHIYMYPNRAKYYWDDQKVFSIKFISSMNLYLLNMIPSS